MSETIKTVETTKQPSRTVGWGVRVAQGFLVVVFPLLLVLIGVRLLMTPAFLTFEYNRAGFPEDFFGFTREERLEYAPYAIAYLLNGEGIDFLGDLKFDDGTPLYNARELRHMVDVKVITQAAFTVAIVLGLLALGAAAFLWQRSRAHLRLALLQGSMLTLGIIVAIVVVAVFNWEFFFTGFHTLFFEGGTWYFEYSDTLIRLFPEQFWFDSALLIGGVTTLTALGVLFVTWWWGRKA